MLKVADVFNTARNAFSSSTFFFSRAEMRASRRASRSAWDIEMRWVRGSKRGSSEDSGGGSREGSGGTGKWRGRVKGGVAGELGGCKGRGAILPEVACWESWRFTPEAKMGSCSATSIMGEISFVGLAFSFGGEISALKSLK